MFAFPIRFRRLPPGWRRLCLLGLAMTSMLHAQRYEAWTIPEPELYGDYNLKAGPVFFDLSTRLDLAYESNLNYSEERPIDDFVIRPTIEFRALWEYSALNAVALNFGLGLEKYLENSQLDSTRNFLLLSPDSELKVNVALGNFSLQLFDNFSYLTDATDAVGVGRNGEPVFSINQYARFNNRAGVRGYYPLNIVDLTFEVSRSDSIPEDSLFDFRRSHEYLARTALRREFAANFSGGIAASFSSIRYRGDFQNDGDSGSFGPFAEWLISDYLTLSGGFSIVRGHFDTGGKSGDTSELDGFSGYLQVQHALNRWYHHRLRAARSQDYGFVSNSKEVDQLTYGFTVMPFPEWRFEGNLSYEEGSESGGILSERFDRAGLSVQTRRQLGPRLFALAYTRFFTKSSSVAGRSYDYWSLGTSLVYDF